MTHPYILAYGYLLLLAPLGIFIYMAHRKTEQLSAERKAPFSQELLRPPGESLRLKIDGLMNQLLEQVSGMTAHS